MNKMIVTVFDSEENAFEGLSALKALNKDGDISLFATAVITKNSNGEVAMKSVSDKGPIGLSVGMLGGAIVGMFGGPAGVALGAMIGSMGGMFYDLDRAGIDTNFVQEVSNALEAGKTAVIADVDESWTAPVDTRMQDLNAIVFRRNRSEVIDEQLIREADTMEAELKELTEDLKDANAEVKESIQKQIAAIEKKGAAMQELISKRLEDAKEESEAKIAEINIQLELAKSKNKEKLEKRKVNLQEGYAKTKANLSETAEKISGYLTVNDLR